VDDIETKPGMFNILKRRVHEFDKKLAKEMREDILDEGLKDWVKKMAAAGIIIGSLAGVGSVINAIDNSVPVVQAMNTALDQAKNSGNMDLAKEIKNDIKGAKLRMDIGKDLNQITYLQDKYKEYMPAKKEDAVKEYNLSPFKQKVMNKITQPSKDYKEKMAALQDIQNNPHTAKDPELQKTLMKRMDQLKTTGESRTVMYTNKLADLMDKQLGEAWSEKYKKSINCSNPKGFSQRAHCQGRKK